MRTNRPSLLTLSESCSVLVLLVLVTNVHPVSTQALSATPSNEAAALNTNTPTEVIQMVEDEMQEAKSYIRDKQAKVAGFANDISSQFKTELPKMIDSILSDGEPLVKEADDMGVDISECIELRAPVPALVEAESAVYNKCAELPRRAADEGAQAFKTLELKADATLAQARRLIAACEDDAQCLSDVTKIIRNRTTNSMYDYMRRGARLYAEQQDAINTELNSCLQRVIPKLREIQEIEEAFVGCVTRKIRH